MRNTKNNITSGKDSEKLVLQLYVSGMTQRSMLAIENIKRICDEQLHDRAELEIIDIYKKPEAAELHHIVFCPSLVKCLPLPRKILIGTMADTKKVAKALGFSLNE